MVVSLKLLVVLVICSMAIADVWATRNPNLPPVAVIIPPDYTRHPDIYVAYKVHTEKKTWSEAKQTCENEGAYFAVIDTMKKIQYIANMKGFNVYVWVGIHRENDASPWLTASDGHPMPNLPWAPGKPQGSHNCLTVRGCNRGLSNENCSSSYGFVCEIPLTMEFAQIMIH